MPVGVRGDLGACMTGRDGGLQRVATEWLLQRLRPLKGGLPAMQEQLIPAGTVLIQQQNRLALGTCARRQTRGVELHERQQAMNLSLTRHELRENAPEPQRLLTQLGTHPVLSLRGCIAGVEDEVDHLE